jgi:hypothetical protein
MPRAPRAVHAFAVDLTHEVPANLTPIAPPISNGIPVVMASPMTTTIGASSGAVLSSPMTPPKWKLALAAALAIVGAGGGTFAIATLGGHRSATTPASVGSPPIVPTAISTPTTSAPPAQGRATEPPAASTQPIAPAAPLPVGIKRSPVAPTTTPGMAPPEPAVAKPRGPRPDSTSAAPTKANAASHPVAPPGPDKSASDRGADRRFDPNAAIGGEEN